MVPLKIPPPTCVPDWGGPVACLGGPVALFWVREGIRSFKTGQKILRHVCVIFWLVFRKYVEQILPNWRWYYYGFWGTGQIQI